MSMLAHLDPTDTADVETLIEDLRHHRITTDDLAVAAAADPRHTDAMLEACERRLVERIAAA